jgi:hypothetical protein
VPEGFNPKDWLSGANAARLADVSLSWIRLLGDRGEVSTLDTDLGRLYYRPDVERIERRRRRRRPGDSGK